MPEKHKREPRDGEFWVVRFVWTDEDERFVAQLTGMRWYPCGEEQGWLRKDIVPLRKVRL